MVSVYDSYYIRVMCRTYSRVIEVSLACLEDRYRNIQVLAETIATHKPAVCNRLLPSLVTVNTKNAYTATCQRSETSADL